jgi:cell division protein FtsN
VSVDAPAPRPIATTGVRTAAALSPSPLTATPASAAPRSGATAEAESYSVIVGSFRTDTQAMTLINELGDLGYTARSRRIASAERGIWYQVLLGPFSDAALARACEARMRLLPGYADARLTRN